MCCQNVAIFWYIALCSPYMNLFLRNVSSHMDYDFYNYYNFRNYWLHVLYDHKKCTQKLCKWLQASHPIFVRFILTSSILCLDQ
jgi:hypothetical protein